MDSTRACALPSCVRTRGWTTTRRARFLLGDPRKKASKYPRIQHLLSRCKNEGRDEEQGCTGDHHFQVAKKYLVEWASECNEVLEKVTHAMNPRQAFDMLDIWLLLVSTAIFMWLGAAMYYAYYTLFFLM